MEGWSAHFCAHADAGGEIARLRKAAGQCGKPVDEGVQAPSLATHFLTHPPSSYARSPSQKRRAR